MGVTCDGWTGTITQTSHAPQKNETHQLVRGMVIWADHICVVNETHQLVRGMVIWVDHICVSDVNDGYDNNIERLPSSIVHCDMG